MGLVALLLLMVAALAVLTSTRASASEHVLFEDDFNADVPPASNDVWGWTDGDGPSGADCSIAVAGGQGGGGPTGYLQLRDGCAVAQEGLVVTGPEGGFVNVCIDFDWGQNTSGTGPTQADYGALLIEWRYSATEVQVAGDWTLLANHDLEKQNPQFSITPNSDTLELLDPLTVEALFEVGTSIDIRFTGATPGSNEQARVDNVVIYMCNGGDLLPDGTVSYTQGFYGASPAGEPLVLPILLAMAIDNTNFTPNVDYCDDIVAILNAALTYDPGVACDDRAALALFLTGFVGVDPGTGKEDPQGYLPAGNPSINKDSEEFDGALNLAAQKITLLLNLSLTDEILDGLGSVPQDDKYPIYDWYEINLDAVQDLVNSVPGDWYDPVLITDLAGDLDEKLGNCDDFLAPFGACDPGTIVLTDLGELVEDLIAADVRVGDLRDAADAMLEAGSAEIDVNSVTVTTLELTNILSLVNKSYDKGVPTAFVICTETCPPDHLPF